MSVTSDAPACNQDERHVLFGVAGTAYAVPAGCIVEMSGVPELTPHPHGRSDVRGIMLQRSAWVPVIDLRARLGLPPLHDEVEGLIRQLEQREREHVEWLEALERSVRSGVPFEKATDPHRCAFGRWFDTFQPPNRLIATLVKRFGEPHGKIHAVAQEALALAASGEVEQALALVEEKRMNELAEMKVLFHNVAAVLRDSQREIAVTVRTDQGVLAFTVDTADGVCDLTVQPARGDSPLVMGLGKAPDRERGVWVLCVEALVAAPEEAA